MICSECGKDTIHDMFHGICWPCNDNKIMAKWSKPQKTITDKGYSKIILNPSLKMSNEEIIELDKKVRPQKYSSKMTLPTDSTERKNYPLFRGLLRYFPAALAGVANTSQKGNEKHNPGQELHHARGKSTDHGDCILRHLMDLTDLLAARDRGAEVSDEQILEEVNSLTWRSLALSQELHESLGVAPLAPGAKE